MEKNVFYFILFLVVVTLSFQVVHLAEHFIQVSVWLLGYQDKPYMSPLGMWAMGQTEIFFQGETPERKAKLSFEMLHLIGNGIFLLGITLLWYFIRSKAMLWAFAVELFHFYEHVSLTLSSLFINSSIGLSTFFGLAMNEWLSVAYRVWWHFFFNLIPSVLVGLALYYAYTLLKKSRKKSWFDKIQGLPTKKF